MDSLVQPCYSQLLPVCLRLPSKFSQGHTVTLHLPNGGVKCQSRIQHTKETCLKPTPSSASILEIPDRHRNYRKQIRLEMLSTNTNKRTLEGHDDWKCSFESSGKACFQSQFSSLPVSCQDFKKTRKFTSYSSKRTDSGNVNVTGQNSRTTFGDSTMREI